jgi:hypothetical protein
MLCLGIHTQLKQKFDKILTSGTTDWFSYSGLTNLSLLKQCQLSSIKLTSWDTSGPHPKFENVAL